MIINLKQSEIEAAIKLYVAKLGIDLAGKSVDIAFTAGRKESGLSAELDIEDSGVVPGFTDTAPLTVVPPTTPTPSQPQQGKPWAVASIANDQTEQARRNIQLMNEATGEVQRITGVPEALLTEPTSIASVKPVSLFT